MSRQFSQAIVGRDARSTGIVICIGWGWEDGHSIREKGRSGQGSQRGNGILSENLFLLHHGLVIEI